MSRIAEAFVRAYGVQMRGGTLRFQAQYLRKIAVPRPESIPEELAEALRGAFRAGDRDAATRAAEKAIPAGMPATVRPPVRAASTGPIPPGEGTAAPTVLEVR